MFRRFAIFFVIGTAGVFADPAADVRTAITAMGRSSYTWEITTRVRMTEGSSAPAPAANAGAAPATVVEGRFEPDRFTAITVMPSKESVALPVTAVFRFGDAVGQTPLGWLRRTEIHEAEGTERDRMVDFEGQSVRLSRAFAAALRAMAMQTPFEELLDLLADIKSYREADGDVIGELNDHAIERLWGDARAKSAPEVQGGVFFRIRDNVLAEYEVRLGIGFPSSKNRTVSWSVMKWTTRIRDIGSTTVTPPYGAVEKLEK